MKLPNASELIVERDKILEYLLNRIARSCAHADAISPRLTTAYPLENS